jgi:hypothetical protein
VNELWAAFYGSSPDDFSTEKQSCYSTTKMSLKSPQWLALINLFARLWFRRLWVIQEVVLAERKVDFICENGATTGRYFQFVQFALSLGISEDFIQYFALSESRKVYGFSNFTRMLMILNGYQGREDELSHSKIAYACSA